MMPIRRINAETRAERNNTARSASSHYQPQVISTDCSDLVRRSLHRLSERLVHAASDIPAPLPASARIPQRPFVSMLQNSWNSQIEALFRRTRDLDQQVVDWARKALYGGEAGRSKPESE